MERGFPLPQLTRGSWAEAGGVEGSGEWRSEHRADPNPNPRPKASRGVGEWREDFLLRNSLGDLGQHCELTQQGQGQSSRQKQISLLPRIPLVEMFVVNVLSEDIN